jgi:hypothetical protein
LENPVGVISTHIRKPDQIIQPWQFGHDEAKKTCLWLRGLPQLQPTESVQRPAWIRCDCGDWWCQRHSEHVYSCACPSIEAWNGDDPYSPRYSNQTPSGQNKLGPSPTRAQERSRTYSGIAEAMAEQWGARKMGLGEEGVSTASVFAGAADRQDDLFAGEAPDGE